MSFSFSLSCLSRSLKKVASWLADCNGLTCIDVAAMESSPRQGLAPDSSSSDESTVKAEPQAPAETHQIDTEENPETRDNMSSSPAPTADRTIQLREKALQDAHKASSAFTGVTEEDMEVMFCCADAMSMLKLAGEKTNFRTH